MCKWKIEWKTSGWVNGDFVLTGVIVDDRGRVLARIRVTDVGSFFTTKTMGW